MQRGRCPNLHRAGICGSRWVLPFAAVVRSCQPAHIHVEKDTCEAKLWLHPKSASPRMMATTYAYFVGSYKRSQSTENESRASGMNTLVSLLRVRFDEDSFWVDLSDGRVLGVLLAWFPRLLNAAPEQREQVRVSSSGLHWEALDEDISISGLLAGLGDQTNHRKTHAA